MKKQRTDGTVIIKKYANRRLYNTESSSYITLDHLAAMTRAGRDFKVLDAKTDEDITHNVLTQIIMEEESRGQTMLPVPFLRQLIALYGDSMQAMVPGYLEASMDSFHRNQAEFKTAVEGAFAGSPFAEIAKRNMEMFEAAANAFTPTAAKPAPSASSSSSSSTTKDDEIAALKAELAKLQDKVEKLVR
ncbi:polyhydroxyalkanoate synthesis repressor PhaR [uncultured Sphingomonas sp.]|uniref:polyhydroxyalkanoate synthesis repressor PhaR n=1 Tax=uncultured Sphingomonas sp. TaxID=158754 RepID=UPI002618CC1E|nr:polyhydroxyalkanoate synthesis repressor PhaR [uncultured Sphingomonas sp.]